MEKLKDLFIDTIDYLKYKDHDKYEEIESKLYEIYEGKKLTEEIAKEWVTNMIPTYKWSIAEIEKVKDSHKLTMPTIDLYVIMNMLYTDYGDVLGEDLDKYIKLSIDWYNDKDINMTGSEKLYCYWKHFIKKKVK
jgi:hypothetical protein